MRLLIVFFTLLSCGFLTAREHTRSLKVLIVSDTISKNIQAGSLSDIRRMTKSFRGIATQTGLRLHLTVLKGGNLTAKKISSWIQSLSSTDAAFCYYSGHGIRVPEITNEWPCIVLPGPHKVQAIAGSSIIKEIKQRHPRLSIVVFDCCNRPVTTKAASNNDLNQQLIIKGTPKLPGIKKLFLHSKGMFVASAAARGEAALTVVRSTPSGGVFTTGFLATLQHLGNKKSLLWDEVFSVSGKVCTNLTNGSQHPFHKNITSSKKK